MEILADGPIFAGVTVVSAFLLSLAYGNKTSVVKNQMENERGRIVEAARARIDKKDRSSFVTDVDQAILQESMWTAVYRTNALFIGTFFFLSLVIFSLVQSPFQYIASVTLAALNAQVLSTGSLKIGA